MNEFAVASLVVLAVVSLLWTIKIGRASCRERVFRAV